MKRISVAAVALVLALSIATALVCLAPKNTDTPINEVAEPSALPLSFDENGEFTILHLTDFHEWLGIEKSYWIQVQDTLKPRLEAYICDSVYRYSPDLIVLGGDKIFSLSAIYDSIQEVSLKTYKKIASLMEELGVYWTMTFGNHDSESTKNKYDFISALKGYPHFIGGVESGAYYESFVLKAKEGESDYVSNFVLPVYKHGYTERATAESIGYNLFIMDSGSYDYVNHNDGYRSIRPEQSAWYRSVVERNPSIPSVMFTHIPFPECETAYLENGGTGYWAGISPSYVPSDILETIMELKNTRAVFFGHNHLNSWTGSYTREGYTLIMGITPMAQAQSYYDETPPMGGRVITLKESGEIETEVI